MKSILILGGTYYVGKKLVSKLLTENYKITIATRGLVSHDFQEVEHLIVDRRDQVAMQQTFGKRSWDFVIDQICFNQRDAEIACQCFQDSVGKYIFSSSQAVYPAGYMMPESFFSVTHDQASLINEPGSYSKNKRLAELYFYKFAKFPVTAVRFPIILANDDPGQRLQRVMQQIYRYQEISIENPVARISLIDADDAANFLCWLLQQSIAGPINVCSQGSIAIADFLGLIQQSLAINIKINIVQALQAFHPYSVHTAWENNPALFPFSIAADWVMDPAFAAICGYRLNDLQWLAKLIEQSAEEIVNTSSAVS